jgi:hypothetical protein
MKIIILLSVLLVSLLTGCTDAKRAKVFSIGDSAKVDCYSGGKLIYSGLSSGKVSSVKDSDGYFFVDKSSGDLMEVSGNCVINYIP